MQSRYGANFAVSGRNIGIKASTSDQRHSNRNVMRGA
jgi:hypothetical protein